MVVMMMIRIIIKIQINHPLSKIDNCVGDLVIRVIVFTVLLYSFVYIYFFFFVTSKDYCHRVKTQLQ